MTEILILALLLAGLVELVRFTRHDSFAGPSLRAGRHDDLGAHVSQTLRPAA